MNGQQQQPQLLLPCARHSPRPQVGRQELALGLRFSARCVLDIDEHLCGLPEGGLTTLPPPAAAWPPWGSGSSSSSVDGGSGGGGGTAFPSWFGSLEEQGGEASEGEFDEGRLLRPRSPLSSSSSAPCRDIAFRLVDGDFQVCVRVGGVGVGAWVHRHVAATRGRHGHPAPTPLPIRPPPLLPRSTSPQAFQGVWRLQEGRGGPGSTRLSYSLFVRPAGWLPVALVEARIKSEIGANLAAVRDHVQRQQQQQRQRREGQLQQRQARQRDAGGGGAL